MNKLGRLEAQMIYFPHVSSCENEKIATLALLRTIINPPVPEPKFCKKKRFMCIFN
jgi:hypothetical protein